MKNRRMPNGTYGGVRGRKTKVGRKLLLFSSYSIHIQCLLLNLVAFIVRTVLNTQ